MLLVKLTPRFPIQNQTAAIKLSKKVPLWKKNDFDCQSLIVTGFDLFALAKPNIAYFVYENIPY